MTLIRQVIGYNKQRTLLSLFSRQPAYLAEMFLGAGILEAAGLIETAGIFFELLSSNFVG